MQFLWEITFAFADFMFQFNCRELGLCAALCYQPPSCEDGQILIIMVAYFQEDQTTHARDRNGKCILPC